MPKATTNPTRPPGAGTSLGAALAAPLNAASLRAAADRIDRVAPKTRAEADAVLRCVVTNLVPVLSGAFDVLIRVRQEMTVEADAMDEGGTVMIWAGMIALVVAAFDQPLRDLDTCLRDEAAAGGVA